MKSQEPRVIIVHRESRLDELKRRYNTIEQARFYVEHLGANFEDYEVEDNNYKSSLKHTKEIFQKISKVQLVDRSFLSNFVFSGEETVVVVGQDGLVANTLKYVREMPVVGVNPDPKRYDGVLLPFNSNDIGSVALEVINQKRTMKPVTLAKAELSNGQSIVGVNDIFIGPNQHTSARYELFWNNSIEIQSSSGIIISTGLGSTGWFSSIIEGAKRVAGNLSNEVADLEQGFPWDSQHLYFNVREPFPSNITGTNLVFGKITSDNPLLINSQMPENGVIFSDGILDDSIDFHSGLTASIGLADWQGRLMI